ncbi:unnamed protein product [Pedinophyceae sp. YPF-701]|nr:unnamed protein product [Pedinophyceae sp. YPF-701]
MNLGGQDWDTVVLSKKRQPSKQANSEQAVNVARKQGAAVDTAKKYGAAANTQKGTTLNTAKLDRETEELKHNRVSPTLAKAIQQARLNKKLTQAQLAQQINETPKIIQEYEQAKAIPNPQLLSKMSRVLGTKLTKNM